jgi:hypothetical protein
MEENKPQSQEETNRKVGKLYHSEKAKAKLKKSGMVFPSLPNIPDVYRDEYGAFKLPEDITNVAPKELGTLYSLLTGLTVYYGGLVALLDVDKTTAHRMKDYLESQAMLELDFRDPEIKKQYPNREMQEAYINCDPRVIEVQDWFDRLNADYVLAEMIYRGYERYLNLVSREITRRSNFMEIETRQSNLR